MSRQASTIRDSLTSSPVRDAQRFESADDLTLGAALNDRDELAFAECFRRHAGRALGLAQRFVGDGARAEEVVQEVFARLWSRPERFDAARGSMRNFLLADIHWRAVDVLRADRRRTDRELTDASRRSTRRPSDVDLVVLERVAAEEIRRSLCSLSTEEREAIVLAYFGGQSYREVALVLGVPEGTVKSRIRTGLRRLRVSLEDWQFVQD